jgi:hypothetical protein
MEDPFALASDVHDAIFMEVLPVTVKSNLPDEANMRELSAAPPELGFGNGAWSV